jgi:hypothetical protein
MPRYFFHLKNVGFTSEPLADVFPDDDAARKAAGEVALEVAKLTGNRQFRVFVTDDAGDKIADVAAVGDDLPIAH